MADLFDFPTVNLYLQSGHGDAFAFLDGCHTNNVGCVVDGHVVRAFNISAENRFHGCPSAHQHPHIIVRGLWFILEK